MESIERESMEFDVVIVGAGPAGLATAIRLAQLNQKHKKDISICVLDKGSAVGAHILSGNVFEPRALDELLPDWRSLGAPIETEVTQDEFFLLNARNAIRLPTPPSMHNKGNYIISLSDLCAWLSQQAEQLGVNIFPGFAAAQVLFNENDRVIGVQTGDMGLDKQGDPTALFQAGINLHAKQTILAEGCRGSLSQQLMQKFNLRENCDPQSYAIGIKELWQIDPAKHQEGKVIHTLGWPLDSETYGGSFIYHFSKNRLSIGFVIGLDYRNPYLDPFEEFQRFKLHPKIKPLLEGGQCLNYGARALNEGGWQSIPKLTFSGGMLVGCGAGFLNVAKIKGTHTAMKSGMLAAEAVFEQLDLVDECDLYPKHLRKSWIAQELKQVRNVRPGFHKGLWLGLAYAAFDQYVLRGHAPWTFRYQPDHDQLGLAKDYQPITYPKPDGVVTFDRLSQVFLSGTRHNENEPCHLVLKDPTVPVKINLPQYTAPEQRYCPAGVYEIVDDDNGARLQINAANCVHCKTCDIKDPTQNIVWVVPEGGDGPSYTDM